MPALRYIPLGGLGEVGMNMWALEWEGQVLGVFLTHGHEDHIGGLPFLLKRLNVPVYGTAITLGLVKPRLREHRVLREADLRTIRLGDRVQLGPFRVETIPVCHSIPGAAGLAIETPVGRVVYTSDFKLERDPPWGHGTDVQRFRRLGDDGVLLLLSDSTNAEREGVSGSERELLPRFESIFDAAPGRIVVATFASNIHRIQLVVRLAAQHGRHVALAGRSLRNAFGTARELGYLDVPEGLIVRLEDATEDDRLVLLTAGSQGEPVSALARFAARQHPVVNVRSGDWVVISARPIPGNERLVHRTIDNLYRNGADRVFYSEFEHVHVSGHAHRSELREIIRTVRPRFFVPVHGEYRPLYHHAQLAREEGMPIENVFVVEDGRVVELTRDSARVLEEDLAGYVFVDGLGIGDVEQVVLRDRRHLASDGMLVATVGLDRDSGAIRSGPELITRGFIDPQLSDELMDEARSTVLAAVRGAGRRPDPTLLKEAIHDAVSRVRWRRTRRRPMVI